MLPARKGTYEDSKGKITVCSNSKKVITVHNDLELTSTEISVLSKGLSESHS